MKKLMRNWIFTMIACILMAILAALMILDGFDVGGLHIADRMLHLVAAVALVIYVVFALFPLLIRCCGVLRAFVLGEIAILLLTALAHACAEWIAVPLIGDIEICTVLGLALWLRATVEIVRAYLSGAGDDATRVPLWKLLVCILLAAAGVWQMASPLISDRAFIFAIGAAAGVMAILFALVTLSNRKVTAPARAEKKRQREEKKAALAAALVSEADAPAALAEKSEENKPKED